MLKPNGYATIVDPDRPLFEQDTAQCCHCGGIIFVKPHTVATTYRVYDQRSGLWRDEPGASCWHCMKPVCLTCHADGRCVPLEKRLRQMERSA